MNSRLHSGIIAALVFAVTALTFSWDVAGGRDGKQAGSVNHDAATIVL
jgi:hypothetical protein